MVGAQNSNQADERSSPPGKEANGASPVAMRGANLRSASRRRGFTLALVLGLLLLISTGVGWLYLNREVPVVTLKVAAGPYRSDSYELMRDVAAVVARQSDRVRLEIMSTENSSKNISILNAGEVDLATIRSDTPVAAEVRMIAELFPDYFQLITRIGSGISSVNDLEGKRVGIPPFGTDEFRSFWSIGDHYDLSLAGVKWQAMRFEAAAERLLNGELDAIFTVRSLRDRLLLNLHEDALLKNERLTLVAIDQAPAIAVKRPFLRSGTIPKGVFAGDPTVPFRDTVSATVTRTLVTREDVDPELIRELTSVLFESRLDLVIRFALAAAIQAPTAGEGSGAPIHEGADAYFNRDQPSFIQENAEPIALGLTIAGILFSGLLTLRSRLTSGQKNRMDSYNYMLLEIAERARSARDLGALKQLQRELFDVLEKVVRALDTDEVTEEGFQSFSLLWESVREMIKDQRQVLVGETGAL